MASALPASLESSRYDPAGAWVSESTVDAMSAPNPNPRDQGSPRRVQYETRMDLMARLEDLAAEVDRVRADAGFSAMLAGIAKLWRYSVLNHILIIWQRPTATSVHGQKQWAKLDRWVKDGEQGSVITAPSGTRGRFVWVEVFDIEQTDGPPVPELKPVDGECSHVQEINAAAERLGISIEPLNHETMDLPGSVVGLSTGGVIYVKEGLGSLAHARTVVHELAHELLHQERFLEKRTYKVTPKRPVRPPRPIREAEADAAAFVVVDALGYRIDTPTYLAWVGADGAAIYRSLKRIHAAATGILRAIEGSKRRPVIPWWAAECDAA